MVVLQINSHNFGSTGNIMVEIAEMARNRGIDCVTSCPEGKTMRVRKLNNHMFIGSRIGRNLHIFLAKQTGLNGLFSVVDTWRFLSRVKKLHPDVVHLHNLHNCYINLPMLFRFLDRQNIPVVWTLHDCWAFTGKCPHFDLAKCDRWKNGCFDCPQLKEYPASMVDRTPQMWTWKKKWFNGPKHITIVTPSKWLANHVSESILGQYPTRVIPNGIDLSVFQPRLGELRRKLELEGKTIVLGVAFSWGKRKGLDVFAELAKRLDDRFQIVLVGTDPETDALLPENIISIHRTREQQELAEIYTAAEVFVNPTREETLGMVNVEALACGTPVVTFRTGGSPECLDDSCGSIVECDDIDALEQEIRRICTKKPYSPQNCRTAALAFNKETQFNQYCDLYEELYGIK